jgi:hypothetical protein
MAKKSVTITFISTEDDEESRKKIIAELDAEMNDDATQFVYNTKAYFRVYTFPDKFVLTLTPTDGVISQEGSEDAEELEAIVRFTTTEKDAEEAAEEDKEITNESSVSKPVKKITSFEWFGTNLGSISADGITITASKFGIGVCKINYTSNFRRYGIIVGTKDEEEYPVIVWIEG